MMSEMQNDEHVEWFLKRFAARPPGMPLEALLHELVDRVRLDYGDLARALLAVEWIEHDETGRYCSSCRNFQRDDMFDGHAEDCALDAALRKAGVR